jgi:hypothetical protein
MFAAQKAEVTRVDTMHGSLCAGSDRLGWFLGRVVIFLS